jgi:hemerythrin-like domain-containing protein
MDREEGDLRHPVTPLVSQIQNTHRRIRSDLEVLEKSDDLDQIGAAVSDLPGLLKGHFQDEEKQGGLFEELESLRPGVRSQLKQLRLEHRKITHALEGLERRLREAKTNPDGELQRLRDEIRVGKATFLQLLHQHERVESGLVAEVYYTEDGGSG